MSVKSAVRVLEIFELLRNYPQGLTIKEIGTMLNFPQSSTFNLVKTLYEKGYLSRTELKKYKLGPKLIDLGTSSMESMDLCRDARVHLEKLMQQVEETVFMAILSGDEMVYVAKIDNNRSIRTSAQIGSRRPMYCTGLGKAILAFLSNEKREGLLAKMKLEPITEHTITDRNELEKQLRLFKDQGYAIDNEENEEGLYCIAAPVFDATGDVVAAVSVAGPKDRMKKRHEFIVFHVLNTTRTISRNMGYSQTGKEGV
ncbi:IclR family transcriptional regulator [Thermoflavimicrobium dichotomicum]|uniref:DNA-binding transcriptional regulator, IclR family n=1 Tax=Thermoflavimicrobium dichotomicum TaxID=46223 RepID=A0A1I3P913_9BACL|nr:IclR family transcriptional regulator [Thermoflavimicrobium dichotomicum]SFJ17546.1 DNA-binding transcriptional regulator, IclR family [Thermoflavimicrobium dichotomicum]